MRPNVRFVANYVAMAIRFDEEKHETRNIKELIMEQTFCENSLVLGY